ncbi:HOTHEAD-like protein [Drosera capensis]
MNTQPRRITVVLLAMISMLYRSSNSEEAPSFSFVKQATQAPPVMFYDYIIIGGGTAGCALAATLSQSANVLLLERGGSPYGNRNIENIALFAIDLADPNPTSPAQRFISEDGVINARARVLGGGSAVNAGFYSRASHAYIEKVGWDEALVNQSYEWVERKLAFQPPVLQFQSAFRDGLVEVGVEPYNGFTYDHIYGTKVGGTIFDSHGHRHSAADLLEYAYSMRTTVYLHATVPKILFDNQKLKKPKALGVIFSDALGIKHKAFLRAGVKNEIILSAGAIGSPQLLMLSGIGPASELQFQGIDVVLDQPFVGQGMADNPMNALFVPSPSPVETSLIQVVGITQFKTYIEAASGSNFATALALNLPEAHEIFSPQTNQSYHVPNDQKLPIDISNAYAFINSLINGTIAGGLILEKITGPHSKGYLRLKSSDPQDNPSVTFNYFQEPEDLLRCIKGMETIIKVIDSKPFSRFRYPGMTVQDLISMMVNLPLNLRQRHLSDTISLEQFCKDTVMTIWHYHGGCHVGKVVDKEYQVMGVSRLRVIDGSTFYESPGTNPQATVMMLGRYMGRRILKGRLGGKIGKD